MSRFQLVVHLMCLVACSCCARSAEAQCDTAWEEGGLSTPLLGANGSINAIWSWSLPGEPTMLIVGGDFSQIGGIAANNIAAWDGQFWHALGSGLSDPVHSLTTHNFALIAGGQGVVAAWNGDTWTSIGFPLPTISPGVLPKVFALAVFNGELYAGGDFLYFGNNPGPGGQGNLWKYNGTNWQRVPAGIGSRVYALQVFDPDGGGPTPAALYVGGDSTITSLRKWDGVTATAIQGPYINTLGDSGVVYALTVVNSIGPMPGGLIVGGIFAYIPNPAGGNITCPNIARFDGNTWSTMAGGINSGYVSAIRAYGSDLYVGGGFGFVGGTSVPAPGIARFNGSQWFGVGGGTNAVKELREYNGQLIVGGAFSSVAGKTIHAPGIVSWNGFAWSQFSEPFSVLAMTRIGSRIVVGGGFSTFTTSSFPTTVTNRYNIFTWDTVNKSGCGRGTNGPVRALTSYTSGSGPTTSNNIVAAGDFTSVGPDQFGFNIAVNRVALWSEPSLTPAGWSAMGSGFNGSVYALDRFFGNTVAGGAFTASGGTSVSRLAKWSGSPASWQPLTTPDAGLNGPVRAFKVFQTSIAAPDSYLVIGGDFTSAPGTGVTASRIIQRREHPVVGQSAWQALGAGFNGSVYAIERFGNGVGARTYAAGAFTASGATTLNRIARWSGSTWEAVGIGGAGGGFNGAVYALKSAGGFLFAAGSFTSVDGVPAFGVAKWNGTAWTEAAGGTSDTTYALLPYQTELIAGGIFQNVQSGTVFTAGMARLKASGAPWIFRQPLSQTRDCFQPVYFDLVLPVGYESATFQWRRDGVPLSDGTTSSGSLIVNAQTNFMNIYSTSPSDMGAYDCIVTNACGSATSTGATLTINGNCCLADIAPQPNGDGVVNVTDLLAVITSWGTCSDCGKCPADIAPATHDCVVNVSDLLAVITNWGACP